MKQWMEIMGICARMPNLSPTQAMSFCHFPSCSLKSISGRCGEREFHHEQSTINCREFRTGGTARRRSLGTDSRSRRRTGADPVDEYGF